VKNGLGIATGAGVIAMGAVVVAASAVLGCTRVIDAVTAIDGGTATCAQGSTDPDCQPTPWPTADGLHTANSDPWLVTHNQVINAMNPEVLVLNFDNGQSTAQAKQYAESVAAQLSVGSAYHGYSDSSAPAFLNYKINKTVDLTDPGAPPMTVSSLLPVTTTNTFDTTALFSSKTLTALYGYSDGNGGYLTLCQLFEKGVINEVWIEDGGDPAQNLPRAPLYEEQKQGYDSNGRAIPNDFLTCIGETNSQGCNIPCGVTVRLAHLDPGAGVGCDVQVRGWGIEGMWAALPPSLATDANAFLNQDFRTRFGVSFDSWTELCGNLPLCVSYPNPMEATSTSGDAQTFDFRPFDQGCGNSMFPPNATFGDDFANATPVNSRCEGFGLSGGSNGGDAYRAYSASTVASLDQMYTGSSRCPSGWQIYWRQSMPGYQNKAHGLGGAQIPNWWPVLFY
jgi:hypothetical protein